jgi:TolB protein
LFWFIIVDNLNQLTPHVTEFEGMLPINLTRSLLVLIVMAFFATAFYAQETRAYFFDDPAAFAKASANVSTIDFEAYAPKRGFGKYRPDTGMNVAGIGFKAYGGGRFGAGTIYVPSRDYIALNPGLTMLDGAHVAWSPPNQPGNAYLELRFPAGVKSWGADLWTMQPVASPLEITVVTQDGRSHTATVTTKRRPERTFAGVVSEVEIASLRFTLAKGQSGLMLDNLAFGAKADGVDLAALSTVRAERPDEQAGGRRLPNPSDLPFEPLRPGQTRIERDGSPPPTDPPAASKRSGTTPASSGAAFTSSGSIFYVRDGKEIRAMSSDGKNDRRFWTHEGALPGAGINELAWSPDGGELAFSSGHDSVASYYHADIYAIKPDGTSFRRITNTPDRKDYGKYGKGTVTVTVRNEQPIYRTSRASQGIFIVYVVGADMPQPITLPPGSSRTLTFRNVADFGDHAQAVVAINAATRWIIPGTDVQAGKTVKAPDLGISGDGLELLGAFRPVWKRDGSRISYRNGLCIVSSIASRPPIGHSFDPLFKGAKPPAPCAWDWGPTAETADQLLYFVDADEAITMYRITGSGQHPGEKIVSYSKEQFYFIRDLRWLPDGSGFLFSAAEVAKGAGNIYRYDLGARKTLPVTNLEEGFPRSFSIAPDGRSLVFERTAAFIDDAADLWIIGIDGSGLRMLAKNAYAPAWGK